MIICLGACLLAGEARPGVVTFSDGSEAAGRIALVPGGSLQFHDGTGVRKLDFASLRELRLAVESEEMLRQFRMPEAGKAIKEEFGAPYPLRTFRAQAVLADGGVLAGHLYLTALTVDGAPAGPFDPAAPPPPPKRKVVLPAKLQGKPGDALASLVFPVRVAFSDAPVAVGAAAALTVRLPGPPPDDLGALTADALVWLSPRAAAEGWQVDPPLGAGVFLASRRGDQVTVGWPAGDDPDLTARLRSGLAAANDFFDLRELIAVHRPDGGDQAYSLLRLWRQAASTDGAEHAWHVDVWRWRIGSDGAVLLAGRGTLLRGRCAEAAQLPAVVIDSSWWPAKQRDRALVLGE